MDSVHKKVVDLLTTYTKDGKIDWREYDLHHGHPTAWLGHYHDCQFIVRTPEPKVLFLGPDMKVWMEIANGNEPKALFDLITKLCAESAQKARQDAGKLALDCLSGKKVKDPGGLTTDKWPHVSRG